MTLEDFPDRRAAKADQPRQAGRPEIRARPRLKNALLGLSAKRPRTRLRNRRPGPQTRPRGALGLRRLDPTPPPPMRRGHRNSTLIRRGAKRGPTLDQPNQPQPPGQSELASTVFHVRPLPSKLSVVADQQPPDGAGHLLNRSLSPQAAHLARQEASAPEPSPGASGDGVYAYSTNAGVRYRFVFRQSDGTLSSRRGFRSRQAAAAARRNVVASVDRREITVCREDFADFWDRFVADKRPYLTPGSQDVQIPVANQAPDGPLAMISTSNTWNGLTRPYEGMRRGELEARYPSGERNYVRIAAADHLQSVANATLVKELGLRDLFVLSPDGDRYFTADVRTAARNLGLRIVGSANWNTEASEFARLGRRIARTRAEAVFIAGFVDPHGGALVRDLRAQLDRDVALIAPTTSRPSPTCCPAPGLLRTECTSVCSASRTRSFRREASASSGSSRPPLGDSRARRRPPGMPRRRPRSCSTRLPAPTARARRSRELRRTNVEDGILGNIRFDQNGDPVEAPVTIFRVVGKRRRNSSSPPDFRGAVVDRTIMARAAFLR